MEDSIEWKEAKGGQIHTDSEEENDEFKAAQNVNNEKSAKQPGIHEHSDDGEDVWTERETSERVGQPMGSRAALPTRSSRSFSHQRISLSLRRNITALADSNLHKSQLTYQSDSQSQSFETWMENALVAISPTADLILFSSHSPEKVTFIAKLRMDPINQYVTKALDIPLDYDEQVTSILCLPIMSIQKTAFGLVDWTALLVGLSSGYVKFYTEQSICLLSLKFCDEPVVSLKCQTQKTNLNARSETHFAMIADEVLITYRSLAVVVDGVGLYQNLRMSKDEATRNGLGYEPAYNLTNLPAILYCERWKLKNSRESIILDAELLGTRRSTTFDSLKSSSVDSDNVPPKLNARTLAFVGRDPFVACYRESKDSSAHSYTEIIGSIFSLWNKPAPSRAQLNEISNSSNLSLYDKGRLATTIVSSPDKRLAAITDDFGRVLLIDVTNWIVVRVWKGYRSAQCGWIEVKKTSEERLCPYASFLVIYAPKRGLLEVWSAQRGPRVAAFNVGKSCRLLYSGYKMLNMRADPSQKTSSRLNNPTEQSYASHCYLLNAKSENIFSIELPYTYSLYKYGDLKSRDHLLIGELMNAMQEDADVESISEILHRITLAESIQNSILKLSSGLRPSKVISVMESLIIKIMKNYDNQSGETMTVDDMSIIELSKRLIKLSSMFEQLSESKPNELLLPDVNQRLIEHYEEHPQEIDQFAEQLGWSTSEVLRYLSLLSLERSYRKNHQSNPWPSLGEPLAWNEFIACFDLKRINCRTSKGSRALRRSEISPDKLSIRLRDHTNSFLMEDKVVKTSLFLYNRLSEAYFKSSQSSSNQYKKEISNSCNFLEPSTRLILLFQFWLSTKLCNHWKMWTFLQNQIGQISDELKVIAMDEDDDRILIETWKQVYNLILESDNVYAAIIATAAIRSDTIKTIQDNEKKEKLQRSLDQKPNHDESNSEVKSSLDWECLCIDAERMSIVSQQLEDVFLLNLLLMYSPHEGHLIANYLYRLPRISVANILRSGPTIVSELVAQWAVQSEVNLKIFTQPYGSQNDEELFISGPSDQQNRSKLFAAKSSKLDYEEHAKELLHHSKTSFPNSLEPDVIILNCVWDLCKRWTNSQTSVEKTKLLRRVLECLHLLSCTHLSHKLATLSYKTFFQRTFERLVILVETNSNMLNVKNSRTRDALTRKELNMGEECVEDFVQFCCSFSEIMMETYENVAKVDQEQYAKLKNRLLAIDSWWTSPSAVKMLSQQPYKQQDRRESSTEAINISSNSLIKTTLFISNLFSIDSLVELNKLANLLNLIFKLKVVKAYPVSLIGEESRQILQLDQQQLYSTTQTADFRAKTGSILELRQRFARKCIMNIVCKITEETSESNYDEYEEDVDTNQTSMVESSSVSLATTSIAASMTTTKQSSGGSPKSMIRRFEDNGSKTSKSGLLCNVEEMVEKDENNEFMVSFANLLSLTTEWQLDRDELYLEFVFELYRCNHDQLASQLSTRIQSQQTLANGLLKISSQRVLVLFGLSPHVSSSEWRRRTDKWSVFQPKVASWLKSIQQEEMKREIACLSFADCVKSTADCATKNFGLQLSALRSLRVRTKVVLERITRHLDGQASRLAYDLLRLLDSKQFDEFLETECN